MKLRKALATTLAIPLLATTACNSTDNTPTPPSSSTTSTTAQKPATHTLNETITVGDEVIISDIKLSTEGCTLKGKAPNKFIKFQMIATVENKTQEEIPEILWASDFRYEDSKGMTLQNLDNSDDLPCETDGQSEFNEMRPGEKRRASITLVAPKDAVTMTYKTNLIPGAEPVVWDVKDELKKLRPVAPAPTSEVAVSSSQPEPVQEDSGQEDPAPASPPQPSTVFNQQGRGYQCPGTDAFVNNPADCNSQNLGGDPIYDEMYPGGRPKQPSPWVQGQIDWANCMDEGHSAEECRQRLN